MDLEKFLQTYFDGIPRDTDHLLIDFKDSKSAERFIFRMPIAAGG